MERKPIDFKYIKNQQRNMEIYILFIMSMVLGIIGFVIGIFITERQVPKLSSLLNSVSLIMGLGIFVGLLLWRYWGCSYEGPFPYAGDWLCN